MLVLNNIEDQLSFLVFGKITEPLSSSFPYTYILRTFINPFSSSEPFTFLVSILLKFIFGINYLSVFLGLTLLFNVLLSYLFFKRFKFGLLYSLIFSFSGYLWLHLGTHMSLSQLWLYPLFMIILFNIQSHKYTNAKSVFLMSLFLSFAVFVSNYIGFFILLYFCLDSLWNLGASYLFNKKFDLKYLSFVLITLVISGVATFTMKSSFVEGRELSNLPPPYRTLEDFFYFSTRPWYPFIPSPKNIIYGDFATNLLNNISSSGNFLADDYFVGEHGAAFFGYLLLLTFVSASFYLFYKGTKEQKISLGKYWFISICLFFLMLPPYFTLSGITIYTPGYLVYLIFPMFRTLIRMSILILFNLLIVLGIFFSDLFKKYPKKKIYITAFIFFLTVVTIFETFVPIKIRNMNTPLSVYSYLGNTHAGSNFIVYPYSKTNESIFWLDAHKSYLLNPRMYNQKGFDSETFTMELNTIEGISKITSSFLSVDYLVVFKDIPDIDRNFFFNNTNILKLEMEFEDAYLFKVLKSSN